MYYKCVKFHKNPISRLGGVALTKYMDGRTDGRRDGRTVERTDGQGDSYIPSPQKTLFAGGIISHKMLKISPEKIAKPILIIFNKSLQQSKYPSNWKIAHVIAI